MNILLSKGIRHSGGEIYARLLQNVKRLNGIPRAC